MGKRSGTLYVLCEECGHFWVPKAKDKSARHKCRSCGSRATAKATAEEIGDYFRDNIERRVWDKLREKLGLSSDTAPDEILDHVRKKAQADMPKPGGWDICPVCGCRPGCKCEWCGLGFGNFKARTRHEREEHPDQVRQPGGQPGERRKKRPEDPSSKVSSVSAEARDEYLRTVEERRLARLRAKPEGADQPIHKRIGLKADKLERIVAEWEKAPERTEIGESGRPRVSEEHNVHWIEIVGRVGWNKAHRIFHEVLMKGVECTLPIGYKPME